MKREIALNLLSRANTEALEIRRLDSGYYRYTFYNDKLKIAVVIVVNIVDVISVSMLKQRLEQNIIEVIKIEIV